MAFKTFLRAALAAITLGAAFAAPARAEVSEVRISKGFGILYLPLIVMQDQQFLEKRAKAAGLGDVKVTAESSTPVFVGIARTTDADAYLADVEHATLTDFRGGDPVYDTTGTTAPAAAPTDTDIWVARSSGTGIQQVVWPVKNGDWSVVVMNADGSRRVSADVAGGATVPALDWLVPTLLVAAGLGLAASIALLVVALHGPRRNAGATT